MEFFGAMEHLNLHSLRGRRIRADLIETYKLFNGLVDIQWDHFFTASQYSNTRKADVTFLITHCHSNLRKHLSYSNRVSVLCNKLKRAPSTNSFKNQLSEIPNYVEFHLQIYFSVHEKCTMYRKIAH